MVDPEYGIGFPPVYDGKKSQPNPEQNQAQRIRRETLFDIANAANVERRLEVELDEGTLKRLQTWTPDARNIPTSLEVNVFVDAQSAQELDNGHFSIVVGPNVGAMQAGRSLGRFAEFLGPDGTRAYTRAAQAHQASCRGRLPVELNYLSRRPPLTNILVRPSAQQYEISVGLQAGVPPSQSIAVSDLMVGVRGGRFYVRSLRLNRILDICCGHMANIDFAPSICRLLAELMHDGIAMLRDFDWNVAFMHPFLPRVRVGRIVLSVAKWRITERTVARYLRLGSHEAFRTSLEQWRNVWMVPRHVYLADGDNRLVLDLDNDMDIEDLRTEIRHLAENSALTLEEVYPSVADSWLQGSNGKYVAEYVVPLAPRARIVSEPASVSQPRGLDAIAVAPLVVAARRLKTPGSDWLYIKLYVSPSLEEDLLLGTIREFAGEARSSAIVQKWFFVRYADPQPHIRLRYQGTPGALSESLLPRVLSWAQDLVNRDLCLRFSIDTYEPEIERYGGIDSIDLAEEFFAIDSDVTMALLPFLGEQALRRVELAVFGLHYLFGKFGWSVNQRRELFRSMSAPREESGPAYRERKEVIQALIGMRDASPVSKVAAVMARTLESTAAAIEDVGWRFRALDEEGRLTPPLHLISRSLAHMHCNRLGLDRSTERLAYGLLERGYDSMEALAKHGGFRRDAVSDAACGRNEVRSTHSQESN
jgi:thiopeptide-type bacteriocin biosynthesis protein